MSAPPPGFAEDYEYLQQETLADMHRRTAPSYGMHAPAPTRAHENLSGQQELRIHNVLALATLNMDRRVDLDEIIPLFVNASFTPEGFPAVR